MIIIVLQLSNLIAIIFCDYLKKNNNRLSLICWFCREMIMIFGSLLLCAFHIKGVGERKRGGGGMSALLRRRSSGQIVQTRKPTVVCSHRERHNRAACAYFYATKQSRPNTKKRERVFFSKCKGHGIRRREEQRTAFDLASKKHFVQMLMIMNMYMQMKTTYFGCDYF